MPEFNLTHDEIKILHNDIRKDELEDIIVNQFESI